MMQPKVTIENGTFSTPLKIISEGNVQLVIKNMTFLP